MSSEGPPRRNHPLRYTRATHERIAMMGCWSGLQVVRE